MRKGSLLLVALLVLTTGAFAEITGVGDPTVSGSVSLTTGYDLDNEGFGFVNDSDLTLVLPLLDGATTVGGDDGIYGEITVDGIGWQLNTDGFYDVDEDADAADASELEASISAKLYINSIFIGLGQPDFSFNNVDLDDDWAVDVNPDASLDTGGFSVGFMNAMVEAELFVASEGDYRDTDQDGVSGDTDEDATDEEPVFDNDVDPDDAEDDDLYTPNVDSNLVFGAMVTLMPAEGITVPVNFLFDADYSGSDALVAFGMAPSIVAGPATIEVPFDYAMIGDINGMEANPSVSVSPMENVAVALDFLYGAYTDLTAAQVPDGAPGEDPIAELGLTVTDSGAFVPGLMNEVALGVGNLADFDGSGDTSWDVDVDSSFTTNGMKPYVNFGYGSDEVFDLGLGIVLMAEATGLDNTAITLDYTNEALTESADGDETESGRVTFDVTVSF